MQHSIWAVLSCLYMFSYFNFTTFLHFVQNSHYAKFWSPRCNVYLPLTESILCKQTTVKISGKGLLKQVHIFSIQPGQAIILYPGSQIVFSR